MILNSEKNRQAYEYYLSKKAGRTMPSRNDLEPVEMVAFLPHIILLDVSHEPLDFRYRLVGTFFYDYWAAEYTGLLMSEIPHQKSPSKIWENLERTVHEKRPFSSDIPYVGPKHDVLKAEDVIMPLSSNDQSVNMIFVCVDYIWKAPGE